MSTKIVILQGEGAKGDAINGRDIFLEVDGVAVYGEKSIVIEAETGRVATATITIVLPEIEYREII